MLNLIALGWLYRETWLGIDNTTQGVCLVCPRTTFFMYTLF